MFEKKQFTSSPKLNSKVGHFIDEYGSAFVLENISLEYGAIKALDCIQLTINLGDIIFITGPSGSGKTSILNVILGETIPQLGKIVKPRNGRESSLFIASVSQNLKLIGRYTCRQNLQLCYDSQIYQSKNNFNDDLEELARILRIEDRLDLKMKDANGGLRQKVAIIRALLTKPDVLIADEPTSSLDFENAKKIFDLLSFYNSKRSMTVIWATHNRDLVKKFTGRIAHLDEGKLIYSGHACFI